MPGYIPQGRVTRGMASALDVFPTIAEIMKVDLPNDRYYDGISMVPWIFSEKGMCTMSLFFFSFHFAKAKKQKHVCLQPKILIKHKQNTKKQPISTNFR